MHKANKLSLLAVLALLAFNSVASAATFGGSVYGAFNTHTMGDWNDVIDEANASGPGNDFNNVNSSFTGGLDLRMWATPSWLISLGWEPIFLKIENDADPTDGTIKLDANIFSASGAYYFPTAGKAKYGIGAGLDFIMNTGEITAPGSPGFDVQGSAIGFHAMGLGEWMVSPGFGVTAGAGYRLANISNTEFTDGTTTVDSPYDNEYSGVIARLGLAFYLPTK